jgi:hypothetical protein
VASNEHVFVITNLAPPGVVIQLDGYGAMGLAMTFFAFTARITQAPLGPPLAGTSARQ